MNDFHGDARRTLYISKAEATNDQVAQHAQAVYDSYAGLRILGQTWLTAIRTLRRLGVSLADAKVAHDRYSKEDVQRPTRMCDHCGATTADTKEVSLLTARQTHGSPAEYDVEYWCGDCRDKAEYDHEHGSDHDGSRG